MRNPIRFVVILLALSLLLMTACTSPRMGREMRDKPIGRSHQATNVYAVASIAPEVHRVLVLPFSLSSVDYDFMPAVETALKNSLRRTGRFEIVPLSREELFEALGREEVDFDKPLPLNEMRNLIEAYRVDAVLQSEITAFRAYKPLMLGLRSRLFTVDGQVLWSCDEIYDAGNQKVAMGARHYAEEEMEQPYPLQSSYSTLISPQRFAAYVGRTLFATLPPRQAAVSESDR